MGVANQRGIALVLVLLVVALLTAMIIEFDFRTRLDVRAAANFRDDTEAYLLADSAVQAARALLIMDLEDASRPYDSLDEDWATDQIVNIPVADGTLTVVLFDEAGKLDLNSLVKPGDPQRKDPEVIKREAAFRRLLEILNVEPERADLLVDSTIDWIDGDDDEQSRGAESSYYETLEQPYRARNDKLRTLDELGLVQEYDAELLEKLAPHVTVIWEGKKLSASATAPNKININTASAELLAALDPNISEAMASDIVAARPFKLDAAVKANGLDAKVHNLGIGITTEIAPLLTVRSEHFSIQAHGRVGETVRTVRAVVARRNVGLTPKERVKVIAWRVE